MIGTLHSSIVFMRLMRIRNAPKTMKYYSKWSGPAPKKCVTLKTSIFSKKENIQQPSVL